MPDESSFGLRLPKHPVAPSEPPMPTEPRSNDITEVIRLLRKQEERSVAAVTGTDLTEAVRQTANNIKAVSETFMAGLRDVNAKVDKVTARLDVHEVAIQSIASKSARSMSPMPRGYNPEETSPGGGLRVARDEWEGIQAVISAHEKSLADIKKEKETAEAKERKAQEEQATIAAYAEKLEKEAKVRRGRYIKIIAALAPLLTALGGAVGHWILPSTPPDTTSSHVRQ